MNTNDDRVLRLEALQKIVKARDLGPTDLARLSETTAGVTKKSASFWSDLLRGKKPSFGEKLAREIETMLQLGRGQLDMLIGRPLMTMGDLNGFEGQLVTLYRQLPADLQHELLADLNARANSVAPPVASPANPFGRKRQKVK